MMGDGKWFFPPRTACALCVMPPVFLNWDTGEGIRWLNPLDLSADAVPPPPQGTAEREAWDWQGFRAYCSGDVPHPLPARDSLVMTLIGPVGSGKDSLAAAMTAKLNSVSSGDGGLTIGPGSDFEERLRSYSAGPTDPASPDRPHLPHEFMLYNSKVRERASLLLFNTAGEDLRHRTDRDFRFAYRAAPRSEILVFLVSPAGLGFRLLDPHGEGRETTHFLFSRVVDFLTEIESPDSRGRRTVVLALTKCDKYSEVESFPKPFLSERSVPRWRKAVLASEQVALGEFLRSVDGLPLMETLSRLASPVYTAAISGTGSDTGADSGASFNIFDSPAPNTAAQRSLDPLVFGLMRAGVWVEP
ncbi:hypothetical protein SAMN05421879_10155 [Ornithinimicrobium cerasi]|uniref:Uncharacterized protein n=1 Tax=Ornithinimicrobium cerasi TaxID=2248773 RepID=A0A285VF60_9MICO|nr:hypothetical protein SAMN05421879_10155 [Ornithinimicrobium cerasi]